MSAPVTVKSRWRKPTVWIAALTPVLVALIGISSITGADLDSSTGQPNLTAAIVNNDQLSLTDPTLGTSGLAGRVLVGELVNSKNSGFQWDITNAATAQAGLENGDYAAVVTIPENFTDAYISSTTDNPVQAVLSVQTDGSQSYVAALLARALASNLQSSISSALTQTFVDTLLVSFTGISDGLGVIGEGATALQQGLGEMTTLSEDLPTLTSDLAGGSRMVTNGVYLLGDALWSLGNYNNQSIANSATLATDIEALRTYVNTNVSSGAVKTAILAQLDDLELSSDALVLQQTATGLAIGAGAAAADIIGVGSGAVTDGTQMLADGLPLFTQGLEAATTGAGMLASGLNIASEALPQFTPEQAAQRAKNITNPVNTQVTSVPNLPPVLTAVAAFTVPVALWLGALVLALIFTPYERRALISRASTARIVRGSLLPPINVGILQVGFVIVAAIVVGVKVVHHTGFFALLVASMLSFVLLHQGLTAVVGRSAWLASVALLGLQIIAAGVLVPSAFLPAWVSNLGDVLPLSQSIKASQVFLTGGTFSAGLGSLFWLAMTAVLGILLVTIAVARGRRVRG